MDHNVRTAFIQYLKFQKSLVDNQNLTQFIQKAIDDLNAKINLYDYDLVVTPQSSSSVNRYTKFLRFNEESDRLLCERISNQNVLVLDDVTTSGSTLNEMLRTLRILNESNTITVFSLLGRKDLMADCVE